MPKILPKSDVGQNALECVASGERVIVRFRGGEIPGDFHFAYYRDDLLQLVSREGCRFVGFDLNGIRMIPSGFIGALIALRTPDVTIEIYNACPEIREVLTLTHLDRVVTLYEACPVVF